MEKSRPFLDEPDHYWSFADAHLMFVASSSEKYREYAKKFVGSCKKFVQ